MGVSKMKKVELKEQTLIARAQGGTVVITIPKKAGIKPGDTFSFIKYDDGSLAYTPKDKIPDIWDLGDQLSDEEINQLHKDIKQDLGFDPNDVKTVGHERWWKDE